MGKINEAELFDFVKEYNSFLNGVLINPSDLIFEENVKKIVFTVGNTIIIGNAHRICQTWIFKK